MATTVISEPLAYLLHPLSSEQLVPGSRDERIVFSKIRGLEADLSYYFDAEKVRTATEAWARRSMDPADYPRPDLAIEIDLSPSQVDRPAIYSDIGVIEVWRFVRGETLIIELLQPDGSYAAVEESRFLRIRPADVLRWVNEAATERQAVWNRRLNEWAMELGRQGALTFPAPPVLVMHSCQRRGTRWSPRNPSMPSPFPGIDPYLESQHFWEDFHPSFLTYCRDALNEVLPRDYIAQLGERIRLVEVSRKAAKLVRPDIAVVAGSERPSRRTTRPEKSGGTIMLEHVTIPLPTVEMEVSDVWIEVRRRTGRTPVTVIELLSPTNKTGDGYVEYKLKRRSLIRQKIHLVELDLLLGGRRLPMSLPLPSGDYFAFVSRAQHRPDSEVYAWTIHDGLPLIPIPLLAGTPDVALDLAGVFATTYERGRYARLIDYATPPSVVRKPEDRAWAEKQARRGRR